MKWFNNSTWISVLLVTVVAVSNNIVLVHGFHSPLTSSITNKSRTTTTATTATTTNKASPSLTQKKNRNALPSPLLFRLRNGGGGDASQTKLFAWPSNRDPKGMPPDYPLAGARIAFTIAATVLTWYSHASKRCGPVMASAGVTLLSSLTAPGLGQAAMTGTFAGMSGMGILPSWKYALGVGVLTSFLFEIAIHYFNFCLGMGGRLGLTAFVGINVIAALQGITAILGPSTTVAAAVQSSPLIVPVVCGALGSVATIALREASDDNAAADPVRASALVGLLASMLVGIGGFSDFGALCVYGGSFTGMSLPSRLLYGIIPGKKPTPQAQSVNLKPWVLLSTLAIAGGLGGLMHGLSLGMNWWSVPGGWGGKAGTCSFVGVLLFRGLAKLCGIGA